MKKTVSAVLIIMIILCSLSLTSCGNKGLKFTTVGELMNADDAPACLKYAAVKKDKDAYVCTITKGASGKIEIPSDYKDKPVVAVVAESDENDDITSLTVGEGVKCIEGLGSMRELEELGLPSTMYQISGSFNDCEKLETIILDGEISGIKDSFLRCSAVSELTVKGTVNLVDHSFNDCAMPQKLTVDEGMEYLSFSFLRLGNTKELIRRGGRTSHSLCGCEALETIAFKDKVYLDNSVSSNPALKTAFIEDAAEIKGCFEEDPALEQVTFRGTVETIEDSFNDNDALREVSFEAEAGTVTDSFCRCAVLDTVTNRDMIQTAEGSFDKQTEQVAKEKEAVIREGLDNKANEYQKIFEYALQKLADDGAIPALSDKEYREIQFDGGQMKFNDQSVRDRLFAAPDFLPEKVVLLSDRENGMVDVYWLDKDKKIYHSFSGFEDFHVGGVYATDPDDCRYLIRYQGYITRVDKDYYSVYEKDLNSPYEKYTGLRDKGYTVTLVFVIDMQTGEIIHIYQTEETSPGKNGGDKVTDNISIISADEDKANEYIFSLIYPD